jgi:NAD(P)H-dependent FMN reductase
MSDPVLQIVVGSTRPGRKGPAVAAWFEEAARQHGGFDVEVVDLAEVGLPLLDEPEHPRLGRYVHQHTKDWSATVARADAFVFVVPEYNHGVNAATKNALDFLHNEWRDKPVGVVSYGGVSAGTRAMTALKPVFGALRMVPVTDSVNIPFFAQFIDDDGVFVPNEVTEAAAKAVLDELARYASALRGLRDSAPA